jgi:hypothetical protein
MHLARAPRWSGHGGTHPLIKSGATHAFVIESHSVRNETWIEYVQSLSADDRYPLDEIDLLFACLRVSAHAQTGYAQILTAPDGWSDPYTANLMPLEYREAKQYPRCSTMEYGLRTR